MTKAGVFGNCTNCARRLGVFDKNGICVDCTVKFSRQPAAQIIVYRDAPAAKVQAPEDPLASQPIWKIAATRFVMWLRRHGWR